MKVWDFVLPLVGGAVLAVAASADDVSILYNEVARAANTSLLWGPYRPNLYFGVRPRLPKSFMGGLMWANVDGLTQDLQHRM
jgi:mannosyl-oligosaccharide glucosidase